jgi:hypothetical protein
MPQSPQLGYNHNIPHRGRLYHVQTEDSGLAKAHIFTHVFYDGTIIASNKVTYDPEVEVANLDQHIIGLMQESHKAMIRSLRRSEYDQKIFQYIGPHPDAAADEAPAPTTEAPKPAPEAAPSRARREPPVPRDIEPQGPPLTPGPAGRSIDPTVGHPIHATAPAATPTSRRRGPSRVRRRAIGGIGGKGVATDSKQVLERRDIIVGKFASEHQAALDEEILALLREET